MVGPEVVASALVATPVAPPVFPLVTGPALELPVVVDSGTPSPVDACVPSDEQAANPSRLAPARAKVPKDLIATHDSRILGAGTWCRGHEARQRNRALPSDPTPTTGRRECDTSFSSLVPF